LFLSHHHPDWFVQITVARDTLSTERFVFVGEGVIIAVDVSTIPHVKPLVSAAVVVFRNAMLNKEMQ